MEYNQEYGAGNQPQYSPKQDSPDLKWNWGAFMFTWLFGFANRAWLAFLCFIPLFNIVWVFFCGAKGERWAWESGSFEDAKSFRATMNSWNRAGLLNFIISLVVVVLSIAFYSTVIALILSGIGYGSEYRITW